MTDKNKISPLTPEDFTGLEVTKPKEFAAGMPAVINALKQVNAEMSPYKWFTSLLKMNQKGGFDCMGCAWPDPDGHRSVLGEYCENGVKAFAEEATDKKVGPEFFASNSIQELSFESDYWLGKTGRLTHPMILREGASHYEEISWPDAFKHIGDKLNSLKSPDEAVFYTSGRTSNEAAFLYQLFVRQFGTNNLPDCSNMCHESSGVALNEALGIGKGSVTLDDFNHAEVILVIGQNPGTNHPRMLSALAKAKKKGAKIITINPLPESGLIRFKDPKNLGDLFGNGTELTDLFLQVKINGDIPLLKAILKLMWDQEQANPGKVFDHDFIKNHTANYPEFIDDIKQINPEEQAKLSGVPIEKVKEAADLLSSNKKIIACWAMGITQHKNGVENIREIVNLLLVKGSIGIKGGGTCPVRGHSNVQGDRTMGIYEKPSKSFLDSLDKAFNFKSPREDGYDVVDSIKAMHEGKAKVFFAMGGNFLSAASDTAFTGEALQKCDLTVHVSTKLNRSHVVHGKEAIILPCLGRTDIDVQKSGKQFVSVENSMGIVHSSEGHLKPASELLKSEPAIVCELANATIGTGTTINWGEMQANYDNIRNAIEKALPGFEDYNQRVRIPEGFYLPNGSREGKFFTENNKANFYVTSVPENDLAEDEYMMMTIRSHDQYNTTIYGLDDRYRGIINERRIILMNPTDIKNAGYKAGNVVDLVGEYNGKVRRADKFIIVEYDIPEKCTATYFPETNVLVPIDSNADKSNTPTSKLVVIKIEQSY